MKPTGTARFEHQPDGPAKHVWIGGRRVDITSDLLRTLFPGRTFLGKAFTLGDLRLRIVARGPIRPSAASDTYIAMKEGLLAQTVSLYVSMIMRILPMVAAVDRWIFRLNAGDSIPRASATGLLVRFI